jgi:predicted MPP superfamily phosphohydrolase
MRSIVFRLLFISVYTILVFLLHAEVYLVSASVYDFELPYWYLWFLLPTLSFIYANYRVKKKEGKLSDWLYFASASWLGIIFILFSGAVFYGLINLLTGVDSVSLFSIIMIGSALVGVYSIFNGSRLVTKEYEIVIPNLKKEVNFVHLSDIHIGTVHQEKYLQKVVNLTNQQNPDFVLVTGDLFDGSIPVKEEMLKPLDGLKADSYFSTGNHEEYEGLDFVRRTVKNLKMKLLDSELVVHDGVQIIGVNDRQSIPKEITLDSILSGINIDANLPSLLMYHTPVEWEAARKHGIDMMLSGHTHAGQVLPFNFAVRIFFKYVNGLYKKEGKFLHVTPGTGTWGPPMRLGSRNQVTTIKLKPQESISKI